MKSNRKTKTIILIILGILFAFSPIFLSNLRFIAKDRDISSNCNDEFDHDNLKISTVSGKIDIDGNSGWVDFRNDGNCTGSGTYSDPYVIEDLVIDGGGSGSCILIENSDVYFRIEDCIVYNSGGNPNAGIRLYNVDNSQLIDNDCSSSFLGIRLHYCENTIISGNTANYNDWHGVGLYDSDYSTLSGNTANNNSHSGIYLQDSGFNDISGNTAKDNWYGIYLETDSNGNNMTLNCFIDNNINALDDNFINHWDNGIKGNYWSDYTGSDSDGDGIGDVPYDITGSAGSQDNFPLMKCPSSTRDGEGIPGYNLFFLFSILSVVAILIGKKIKKS